MYMMYPMQESRKMRGFDEQRNRIRFIFIAGIAHVVPKLQPATTPSSDFRASSGTRSMPTIDDRLSALSDSHDL